MDRQESNNQPTNQPTNSHRPAQPRSIITRTVTSWGRSSSSRRSLSRTSSAFPVVREQIAQHTMGLFACNQP